MEIEAVVCSKCKYGEGKEAKMMSKRKWFLLLSIFIVYILLGGAFFYKVENHEESKRRHQEDQQRIVIRDTLYRLFNHTESSDLLDVLTEIKDYCGKPIVEADSSPLVWDYYHSVFFSITVVTTIGYGNLAPTISQSRLFMIAYGLIGIPFNGILFATLGDYFAKTFIRIYRRWKNNKVKDYAASLSLVTKIILYLTPGLIIFLVLPAIVIQYVEDWDYVLSIYYAFVTLTTIGFGDYVAGVYKRDELSEIYFVVYQLFLLVWIIFGLGYLVMVIGFLTRGLRSKKMARFEKHITQNIKTTHSKIWQGFVNDFSYLRRIMNELYMARFKPVYRDDYSCCTPPKIGSQSFPDLRKLILSDISPTIARRRAFSECITSRPLTRVQSDTDLSRIDKERTFASYGLVQPCDLLANVASALTKSTFNEGFSESEDEGGVHGFSDADILASENNNMMYGSGWTLGSQEAPIQPPKIRRTRAASEVKIPMSMESKYQYDNPSVDWTWSGPAATQKIQEIRRRTKFDRTRTKTRDNLQSSTSSSKSLFERIKSSWSKTVDEERNKNQQIDIEKQVPPPQQQIQWDNTIQSNRSGLSVEQQRYLNRTRAGRCSVFSVPESRVFEETTVADLIRALSSIHSRVASADGLTEPKRKMGTASLTPPEIPSILDLFTPPPHMCTPVSRIPAMRPPISRRGSQPPSATNPMARRRFSLHPVNEDQLMIPPPPYSPTTSLPSHQMNTVRRPSLFQSPANTSNTVSPPPNLLHKQVSRLRGPANARILYTKTRHDSLKDLRIERP